MPILGPLGVVHRVEQVMKEGFAGAVQRVEQALLAEGVLTSSSPLAPIPPDDAYFREEEPALDVPTGVTVTCGLSEMTNEPSDQQDVHMTHTVKVKVFRLMDGSESSADLHSWIYRYGTAMTALFGAQRSRFELGATRTNDGFGSPVSTAGSISWADPDNVFVSDDVDAVTIDRTVENSLRVGFTLANHIPTTPIQIVGLEVKLEGRSLDNAPGANNFNIYITTADGTIVSDTLASTMTFFGSDTFRTVGGSNVMWGLPAVDSVAFAGAGNFVVAIEQDLVPLTFGLSLDHVQLKVYQKPLVLWGGTIVDTIETVTYRDEFREAGAFGIRSATITMEVERREFND